MTSAFDIEQQASQWLIRSESGQFTYDMRADLDRWLEDPHHRVTYLRLQEAWRRANRMRGTRPLDGNIDPDLLKEPDPADGPKTLGGGSGWRLRISAAAGASLIIYLLVLLVWGLLTSEKWIPYTTVGGGYRHVSLPDGTSLQLNTTPG
jgi:transmembrane sensor